MKKIPIKCKCDCHEKPKDHKGYGCCIMVNEPRFLKEWEWFKYKVYEKTEVQLSDKQAKQIIKIVQHNL